MAIQRPIVDAGPTSSRRRNRQVVLRQAPEIPPASYRGRDPETSEVVDLPQQPERLGQICYYKPPTGSAFSATMYVVVSIDGTLVWKEVKSGVIFIDTNTGKPWNPTANFQ